MQIFSKNISLEIGRLSNGEAYTVNLSGLPHLFISYSHDDQLREIFSSLLVHLVRIEPRVVLALSLSSILAHQIKAILPAPELSMQFTHTGDEAEMIRTIDELIQVLSAEMKTRKRIAKMKGTGPVLAPIVVLIDDIFEVLRSTHRKTISAFIELLLTGSRLGIYFIMASSGIYRNLLQQLVYGVVFNAGTGSLGAELVINPDGLIFYKERENKTYKSLYPG